MLNFILMLIKPVIATVVDEAQRANCRARWRLGVESISGERDQSIECVNSPSDNCAATHNKCYDSDWIALSKEYLKLSTLGRL